MTFYNAENATIEPIITPGKKLKVDFQNNYYIYGALQDHVWQLGSQVVAVVMIAGVHLEHVTVIKHVLTMETVAMTYFLVMMIQYQVTIL